ncbi:MAG: bifunctional transaldolase/phosoglucose isomerase, partial [Anaerolineae bacterium]|nr:bifunctional transaldolase/phosoglucose isomerase [Anaerolineae bacterium]
RRLRAAIARPNVFIKVPATPEGVAAIKTLIGEGINVNATLIFSLEQYDAVAEAYIAGLERLAAAGGDLAEVTSVASLFVSRVDAKVDARLDELGTPEAQSLKGKIALANAKISYRHFKQIFSGERWETLAALGASYQRPLWASTSTKNPDYPDTLYVDGLIGPHTVNTAPPKTLDAFLDHGTVAVTVETGLAEARAQLDQLAALGINLDGAMQELLDEGVAKFVTPFSSLMRSIEDKIRRLSRDRFSAALGTCASDVAVALDEMAQDAILTRIKDHDFFVWQPDPTEIANRLGWLEEPAVMRRHLSVITDLVDEVRGDGYTDVLLLGMGGSSLAADVYSTVFGAREGYLNLAILDSTDPGAVLAYEQQLDLSKTLFIVASKSGGTAETLSFYKYFYNKVAGVAGVDRAGEHFLAITDPGSKLLTEADAHHFRAVMINDPTLGGRYSALSYFGLVPAGLLGVDLAEFLDRALGVRDGAVAVELGAIIGELAKTGRDKLTLVTSPQLANFGDWVEQLVAESTGKDGVGILPVVGEPLASPDLYGDDRLFVSLRIDGDTSDRAALDALAAAGHPVVEMTLRDRYDLGEQIYIWELATAVAGYRLGIQPFNQPNVEAAKVLARQMIAMYQEQGALPEAEQAPVTVDVLNNFLAQVQPGDYLSMQAYVQPTEATTAALQALRLQLRERTKVATTVGYGPRYLHSTGQLHKGDGGGGLFIQFTSDVLEDVGIPDVAGETGGAMSFGVLIRAQALGEQQALLNNNRRVIHFHLGVDVVAGIRSLI